MGAAPQGRSRSPFALSVGLHGRSRSPFALSVGPQRRSRSPFALSVGPQGRSRRVARVDASTSPAGASYAQLERLSVAERQDWSGIRINPTRLPPTGARSIDTEEPASLPKAPARRSEPQARISLACPWYALRCRSGFSRDAFWYPACAARPAGNGSPALNGARARARSRGPAHSVRYPTPAVRRCALRSSRNRGPGRARHRARPGAP